MAYKRVGSPLGQLVQAFRRILVISVKAETRRLQQVAQLQAKSLSQDAPEEDPRDAREAAIAEALAKMQEERANG